MHETQFATGAAHHRLVGLAGLAAVVDARLDDGVGLRAAKSLVEFWI
jgi:hypothetical protein